MSAQETTVFDGCPAIGDDLLQKTVTGKPRFTLEKLKRTIDLCSNPPYFRGVSTPITDLLDLSESKPSKQKRAQTKDKDAKPTDGKTPLKKGTRIKPKPTPTSPPFLSFLLPFCLLPFLSGVEGTGAGATVGGG
jgi:hypothetical protein